MACACLYDLRVDELENASVILIVPLGEVMRRGNAPMLASLVSGSKRAGMGKG